MNEINENGVGRIDGRGIASALLTVVRDGLAGKVPVVRAVVMEPTPVTESYLLIKTEKAEEAGMHLDIVRIEKGAREEEITDAIRAPGADAVIVQLPLPAYINERSVLDAIPLWQDADVLSSAAYERFLYNEEGGLLPPVVGAIAEILQRAGVTVSGKNVVVIGNGKLVGAPVQAWLSRNNASISVLTHENFSENAPVLKEADIVISGAGSPHLVTPDLLKEGVVLIDAGTSESDGAIVGDFAPACEAIASVYTPVPGGVGPVAVACLFKNVAELLGPHWQNIQKDVH